MGKLFETFGNRKYANEAEVSQNFLLPLLTDFLGYDRVDDVIPERHFPAFDIPQNRQKRLSTRDLEARPDYVLQLPSGLIAALDSKGPDEPLDSHLDQLRAYCMAARTNLLLITNGNELRLYDANELIFVASDIEALDLRFSALAGLVGKAAVSKAIRLHDRLLTVDPADTGIHGPLAGPDETRRRIDLALSDFGSYLLAVRKTAAIATRLPESLAAVLGAQPIRVSSRALLEARVPGAHGTHSLLNLLQLPKYLRVVLVGESGIGKTALLHELLEVQAQRCLDRESATVPVLLRLGEYGGHRTFEEHLQSAFAVGGVELALPAVRQLMREGRLLLLLDAYDEAFPGELPKLSRALSALVRDYERCPVVLTTRHTRRPQLAVPALVIEQLSSECIQELLRKQLGDAAASAFLRELRRTHVTREASNTLLLTLMALAFQRNGRLPRTRRLLLEMLLEAVRDREEAKPARIVDPALPWSAIELCLSRLAYAAFLAGPGYSLDQHSTSNLLRSTLDLFETNREVARGMSLSQVVDHLAATGFLSLGASGIVFWHRRIMEHFASLEAARRIDAGELDVAYLAGQPDWQDLLPAAVALSADPTAACTSICARNVFLAGACAAELPDLPQSMRSRIVHRLATLSRSEVDLVRAAAMATLQLLDWNEVSDALESLLQTGPGNVQTEVLPELAARQPDQALVLGRRAIEWHPPIGSTIGGTLNAARIAALAESPDGAAAQGEILKIWAVSPDMYVAYSAREALLRFHRRAPLSDATIQTLFKWALSPGESLSRPADAARVLRGIRSPRVAMRVIEAMRSATPQTADTWELELILRDTDDEATHLALYEASLDRSLPARVREPFARVLADIPRVPLTWFKTLFADPDVRIQSFGLLGMKYFSLAEVSDEVDQAFRMASAEESNKPGYDFLQSCAVESLAAVRGLPLLLEPGRWPARFFHLALSRLADAVSDQRLVEFVPFLQALLPRCGASRAAVRVCYALADLGATTTAAEGIARLLEAPSPDAYLVHDIVDGVHRLPHDAATAVLERIWTSTLGTSGDPHVRRQCVEAMERVGAVHLLKDATSWALANDRLGLECERAIGALVSVGSELEEHWLVDLIQQLETRGRGFSLDNALWVAGKVGGPPLLDAVDRLLEHPSTNVRNAAFFAGNRIRARQGEVWYRGLEHGDVSRDP